MPNEQTKMFFDNYYSGLKLNHGLTQPRYRFYELEIHHLAWIDDLEDALYRARVVLIPNCGANICHHHPL